jgi:hypothetical protein
MMNDPGKAAPHNYLVFIDESFYKLLRNSLQADEVTAPNARSPL